MEGNKIEKPSQIQEPEKNEGEEIRPRIEKMLRERNFLYSQKNKAKIFDEVNEFCMKLVEKYGEEKCNRNLMFQAVLGDLKPTHSQFRKTDEIDFSGEDSIEKLISKLFKIEQIRNKSGKLIHREDFDELIAIQGKIGKFIDRLREKYKDSYVEYALYHAAIGSSPMNPETGKTMPWSDFPENRIDFPGEDSIEKFLERLEEEYKKAD